MRVKLPVKQCACACLLGMVASANLATASGLQIAPVTLTSVSYTHLTLPTT